MANRTAHNPSPTLLILLLWAGISAAVFTRCGREKPPIADKWTELKARQDTSLTRTFHTVGKGAGPVTWWAGGYLWDGGSFTIELIDVRRNQVILKRRYSHGDTTSGHSELPLFKWWHAEEKDRIILQAGRTYRMTLKTENVAQPGAGWGLWLYPIGERPLRHESPKR